MRCLQGEASKVEKRKHRGRGISWEWSCEVEVGWLDLEKKAERERKDEKGGAGETPIVF
jgi:hypothetical protein